MNQKVIIISLQPGWRFTGLFLPNKMVLALIKNCYTDNHIIIIYQLPIIN